MNVLKRSLRFIMCVAYGNAVSVINHLYALQDLNQLLLCFRITEIDSERVNTEQVIPVAIDAIVDVLKPPPP